MKRVALYVREFELGTRLADAITARGDVCSFPEPEGGDMPEAEVAIIDFDEAELHPFGLAQHLTESSLEVSVVGCATRVSKKLMDEAKRVGCRWVFPKSSLVRNLPSVLAD